MMNKEYNSIKSRNDKEYNSIISRSYIETKEEWRKWCDKIPTMKFDSDWNVKIIPPFAGALARFQISKNDNFVSVYFDAFSMLGYMYDKAGNPIPYYEVYDGYDTWRYLLDETDKMMEWIRRVMNR